MRIEQRPHCDSQERRVETLLAVLLIDPTSQLAQGRRLPLTSNTKYKLLRLV